MLTVVRDDGRTRSPRQLAQLERREAPARRTPRASEQDRSLAEVLERDVAAGEEAVAADPDQLDVLAEAGVVDAGGYGVVLILAGLRRRRCAATRRRTSTSPAGSGARHAPRSTATAASGTARTSSSPARDRARRPPAFDPRLEEIGDSVLVVGDRRDAPGPRPHRRPAGGPGAVRGPRRGLATSTWPTCASRSPTARDAGCATRRQQLRARWRSSPAPGCGCSTRSSGADTSSTAARR